MAPSSPSSSHADVFEPVVYGLRRRQRAVLAVAAILAIASLLMAATVMFAPADSEVDVQVVQWFALGFFVLGVGVAAIALTRLAPRNARVYLLLKHQPEAIANIFFDIKFFRGYPYEYMVIQTHAPRRNYIVSGIQRFGMMETLASLRQLCPKARFSCSPTVKHKYFPDENLPES